MIEVRKNRGRNLENLESRKMWDFFGTVTLNLKKFYTFSLFVVSRLRFELVLWKNRLQARLLCQFVCPRKGETHFDLALFYCDVMTI